MRELRDGEPCDHKGCLNHMSHPCEGCGRIGGKGLSYGTNIGSKDKTLYSLICSGCGTVLYTSDNEEEVEKKKEHMTLCWACR